jgi:hypothetical protein
MESSTSRGRIPSAAEVRSTSPVSCRLSATSRSCSRSATGTRRGVAKHMRIRALAASSRIIDRSRQRASCCTLSAATPPSLPRTRTARTNPPARHGARLPRRPGAEGARYTDCRIASLRSEMASEEIANRYTFGQYGHEARRHHKMLRSMPESVAAQGPARSASRVACSGNAVLHVVAQRLHAQTAAADAVRQGARGAAQ